MDAIRCEAPRGGGGRDGCEPLRGGWRAGAATSIHPGHGRFLVDRGLACAAVCRRGAVGRVGLLAARAPALDLARLTLQLGRSRLVLRLQVDALRVQLAELVAPGEPRLHPP